MTIAIFIVFSISLSVATVWLAIKNERQTKIDYAWLEGVVRWERTKPPFTFVFTSDAIKNPRLLDAVDWAISFWDRAVAGILLRRGELDGTLIPFISMAECKGEGCGGFGYTRITIDQKDNQIVAATIYVDLERISDVSDKTLRFAVAHEMGHVLGLAHDDLPGSIMHSPVSGSRPVIVTEKDKSLLKGAYLL